MEQGESSAQSGASARILVVDDDESNLAVLQLMLRRSGYAEVHTTSDSSDDVTAATANDHEPMMLQDRADLLAGEDPQFTQRPPRSG